MRGSKCQQPQNLQLLFADLDKSSHYIQGQKKGKRRSLLANWSQPLQPKLDALPESASQQWAGSLSTGFRALPAVEVHETLQEGATSRMQNYGVVRHRNIWQNCQGFSKVINIESLLGVFLCCKALKAAAWDKLQTLPSIAMIHPNTSYCLSSPALASASVFSTALPTLTHFQHRAFSRVM